MTALLEFKQNLKRFFGDYEFIFMPLIKFGTSALLFRWININMGYMTQLDTPFLVVLLALLCAFLPASMTAFVSCILIVMHGYALSIEVAGFLLVLMLLMEIFFLRYSAGTGIVLILTPLSLSFGFPVMLPIGTGLLASAAAAIPAGCGVVLYYLIRYIQGQASMLSNPEVEIVEKLKMMADGIIVNWGMWITVAAFILVILLVHLIRTRSFDYSWRVAIVAGGIVYILVMLTGSFYLSATVDTTYLVVSTVIAMLAGLLIDFFIFGGDYSRTERLEYEDDEYYYYVKAVPKASVSTYRRSVKKIQRGSDPEDVYQESGQADYARGGNIRQGVDYSDQIEKYTREL